MKPLQKAFKTAQAALCLVNEWRDSLSYTAFTAYTGSQLLHGHSGWLPIFFIATAVREIARTTGWNIKSRLRLRLVGDNSKTINGAKNAAAAEVVANSLAVCFLGSLAAYSYNPMVLLGVPFSISAGGRAYSKLSNENTTLREIPQLYFNKETGMWDWPRKNKNGPTQTQKLKEAIARQLLVLRPN